MKFTLSHGSFGRGHLPAKLRLRSILTTKRYYAFGASMVLLGNCGGGGCAPTATPSTPAVQVSVPGIEASTGPQPYAIPGSGTGTGAGGAMPVGGSIQRPSNDSTGNFRISCAYSHMNYDDSIIRPNQPGASHLHTYFGNTGSNALSTSGSLFNSGNSTCDGGIANRSSYWVPALVDANNQPQIPTQNQIYYKSGYQGVSPQDVSPTLPIGLKVIAGTSTATSAQPSHIAIWECKSTGETSASIPACGEGSYLQARVEFPQCWDGVNLDSADHKSHMAYGSYGVGCPASHPVAIPAITYNVDYIVGPGGTAGWKLSSDMYSGAPGGYSLHGDIITAWDPAISDQWLNNCVRQNADCGVGRISDSETLIFMVG